MRSEALVERLKELQKPVVTLNDISRITGKEKRSLAVSLFRLRSKGKVAEVERGKYALPQQHPFIIASHLVFPSYISFLSAYSYYQITTQVPRTLQVVALRSKKGMLWGNYQLRFIQFPARRMFGYRRERFMEKEVFIAEKEKAIVDSLYLPEQCPLDETFTALGTGVDVDKLVPYALRMDSGILLKRLGYLLELRGVDIFPRVRRNISQRYDLLNPFHKTRKQRSPKWRLIVNEVFEDAA